MGPRRRGGNGVIPRGKSWTSLTYGKVNHRHVQRDLQGGVRQIRRGSASLTGKCKAASRLKYHNIIYLAAGSGSLILFGPDSGGVSK